MNQQLEGTYQYHNSKKEEEGKEKERRGERSWLWRAGPKQRGGLGGGRGQCSGPPGLEEALGAVGSWGLGSRNRRDPGVPPTPGLRGQRTSPGSPAGFLGSSGRGKHPLLLSCSSSLGGPLLPASPDVPSLPPLPPRTRASWRGVWRMGSAWELSRLPGPGWAWQSPSAPLPLLPEGPSRLPLLISRPPSCAPRTHAAQRGLWRGGTSLGAPQAPWPKWARRSPSVPLLLFLEGPSPLPLLISPASGVPILSGLLFSSPLSPPTSYRFTLGFLPSPWASESPTSGWQGPSELFFKLRSSLCKIKCTLSAFQ